MLGQGVLSAGHARALLGLESLEEQRTMGRLIVRDRLSVRDIEEMIKQKKPATARRKTKSRGVRADAQITSLEEELQRLWVRR